MIIHLCYLCSLALITYWIFPPVKAIKSMCVLCILLLLFLGIGIFLHIEVISWFTMMLMVDLYTLFYSKTYQYFKGFIAWKLLIFIGSCVLSSIFQWDLFVIFFFAGVYGVYVLLKKRSKPMYLILLYSMIVFFIYVGISTQAEYASIATICLFVLVESLDRTYATSFHQDSEDFQNQVLSHHYEEVKSVYLNMRGWRHDYHNHIQAMKAYLQLQQYPQLEIYLHDLETDLKRVDQLIKSGNLMLDAILNSKLTLAIDHQIEVTCKAIAPENLTITDIDICVMIGNLLDNAIEACDQIAVKERRIRIYTDIVQHQFYFSITNTAKEQLSDKQMHYISEKRGNHGHGMKRVKLTVDKYEGYLNLKNEPGVFVSELMIPLK